MSNKTKQVDKMAFGERKGFRSFGQREMHTIKCSDCGQDAQVPFKPAPNRAVYCRDCYEKHRK